jgi:NitT/TauT family transport system permease protein
MKDKLLLRSVISFTTLLYVCLIAITFIPGKRQTESSFLFIFAMSLIWLFYLYQAIKAEGKKYIYDISLTTYIFFIVWELVTRIFDSIPKVLFPAPANVFYIFYLDYKFMLEGMISSLFLLFVGFSAALLAGNLLGLFVGYNPRLRESLLPAARIISPIPPMIYAPYLIAIMPSFSTASITVLALGIFWPTFMNMITRVVSADKRILDSAKAMNVSTCSMLLKVLLPYSIPGIISSLRVQLSTTFMLLVMAEMIGAQSGLGFYIKKYSDYADYTRVAAGIIFIALVITGLNFLISKAEKKLIKWS